MAGLFPYLDVQESQGADGPSAGLYGKFGWPEARLGSLSPEQASVVWHLNRTADTGLSQAVPRNAKVEGQGHQGGVSEATRQGVRKAWENDTNMNLCTNCPVISGVNSLL